MAHEAAVDAACLEDHGRDHLDDGLEGGLGKAISHLVLFLAVAGEGRGLFKNEVDEDGDEAVSEGEVELHLA